MYSHLQLGQVIVTLDTWEWGLSQTNSQFFWSVKDWLNLSFCLICTKPIFKQPLPTYLLIYLKKWEVGWNWSTRGIFLFVLIFKIWGCHVNHSAWDVFFNIFLLNSTLFYWVADWVLLDIPWSLMGAEFY